MSGRCVKWNKCKWVVAVEWSVVVSYSELKLHPSLFKK